MLYISAEWVEMGRSIYGWASLGLDKNYLWKGVHGILLGHHLTCPS
jgi:hypothetical protein